MKRVLISLVGLVLLALVAAVALLRYAAPQEPLDLAYDNVSAFDIAAGMLRSRQPVIELQEQDIDNLLKKGLSEHPELQPGVVATGANFSLAGDQLTADLNLRLRNAVPVGVRVTYRLADDGPYLQASFEHAAVRGFTVPGGWLQAPDFTIRLDDYLPRLIGVKAIEFPGHSVRLRLQLK